MSESVHLQSGAADELLRAVQCGSSGAFVKLSEMYEPLLHSEVSRYEDSLGSADLDDLRQGALVSLYRAALSYRFDKGVTFGLYAKVCIVNGIADTLRYIGKKIADVSIDLVGDEELASGENDLESLMVDKERFEGMYKLVTDVLSDLEREIFAMYLDGYSYAEIASALGKTQKSVDNALRRVKEKLKKLF